LAEALMPWEISEDEERKSFEVVEVSSLPVIDRADIEVIPSNDRPCGCHWCDGDWLMIAAASVQILEEGIDPLDPDAVITRGQTHGLGDGDLEWLASLFNPTQAIIHLRNCGQFTNGMHRTHALRMAGVQRIVVYGKGERPFEG
jgi:hypothetical protein